MKDDFFRQNGKKTRKGFRGSTVKLLLFECKGKCQGCKKRFYTDGIGSPQKHHKDGKRSNNKPENLMLICHACHEKFSLKQASKRKKRNTGFHFGKY